MTECRHLYEFAYRCGHSGWEDVTGTPMSWARAIGKKAL
jgi:hypothetical protein